MKDKFVPKKRLIMYLDWLKKEKDEMLINMAITVLNAEKRKKNPLLNKLWRNHR